MKPESGSPIMNFEQQLLADMAAKQTKLAQDFVAVGEVSTARYMFGRAIEKLEMAQRAGPEAQDKLESAITQVRAEITKLSPSAHGPICSTAKTITNES